MQAWCRVFRAALGQSQGTLSSVRCLGADKCFSSASSSSSSARGGGLAVWLAGRGSISAAVNPSSQSLYRGLHFLAGQSCGVLGSQVPAQRFSLAPLSALLAARPAALPPAAPSASSLPGPGPGGPSRGMCQKGQPSRQRVPKRAGFNDTIMPNTTQLQHGLYGIRALAGRRVAANTIEAVRRTLRRKIKKTARLWVRLEATVPVTRKPQGIRMGKGKGPIDYYATPVRPGQVIFEMDRVPRKVALQALQAAQYKFPIKLGFVEWS